MRFYKLQCHLQKHSVVDAVQCAVEIQNVLKAKNEDLPENRRMIFRIGVNLGDVIQEGDRIYGDGVNIAARIEGLADGGGICISGTAYDHIENKLALGYNFMGKHSVKNIAKPVRVYRVPMDPKDVGKKRVGKSWKKIAIAAGIVLILGTVSFAVWNFYLRPSQIEPASVEKMAFPLPDKPSIAVLPFNNLSGDGDHLRKRTFAKALEKAELRHIRMHDLRHTYASLRFAKGDNIQDVSRQLGHATVAFTLAVYVHWLPGQAKSQVDELDSKEAPKCTPTAPSAEIDQNKRVSSNC